MMHKDYANKNHPYRLRCIDHHNFQQTFGGGNVSKDAPVPPPPVLTEEQLKGIFWRYDTHHDGRLDKKELKNAFKALGSRLPGFRADLAMHHADANRDGFIDHDEFPTLVKYTLKHGYPHN